MDVLGYKEKELQYYVLGNVIVMISASKLFMTFINDAGSGEGVIMLLKLLTGASAAGVLIYVYTFLLCALIGGDTKIRIAYFRIGKPKGYSIFSDLKQDPKDIRIKKADVLKKYSEAYDNMPKDKAERELYENDLWYGIYHKYRSVDMIKSSHREFLAFRDMTIITIPLCVLYLVLVALGIDTYRWYIVLFFIIELILTNIAMRKKGERFVKNVIVLDLRDK